MHIIANRNHLLENLTIVERSVPVRSTIPVINGILMEAREDGLFFSSTNLDIGIRSVNKGVDVKIEGSVVLPVKFVDILRQLPDEMVEIKSDQENFRTELNSGKANFFLYGMDDEEFPSFTSEEEWKSWTRIMFVSEEFKKIFKKVIFAVSNDESKPPFRGILIEMDKEGTITCLASDTYRLACLQQQTDIEGENNSFRLLVPGKSLNELLRIIDDTDESVVGYFKENEIVFIYRQFTFFIRLLEDRYPNLMNVFPENFKTRISVKAGTLEKTISRASLLAQGYNNMISLQIEDNLLKVKAGSEMGRMEEELELINKQGENMEEMLMNARFFLDPLRILDKESIDIDIDFNGFLGPCILNSGDRESSHYYRYLVLPIKVDKKEEY